MKRVNRILTIALIGITLAGCATGFPGSPTRSFYNLCVVEGKEERYCEAWAAAEASRLAPQTQSMFLMTLPMLGR
jgi:hypothetical protein